MTVINFPKKRDTASIVDFLAMHLEGVTAMTESDRPDGCLLLDYYRDDEGHSQVGLYTGGKPLSMIEMIGILGAAQSKVGFHMNMAEMEIDE